MLSFQQLLKTLLDRTTVDERIGKFASNTYNKYVTQPFQDRAIPIKDPRGGNSTTYQIKPSVQRDFIPTILRTADNAVKPFMQSKFMQSDAMQNFTKDPYSFAPLKVVKPIETGEKAILRRIMDSNPVFKNDANAQRASEEVLGKDKSVGGDLLDVGTGVAGIIGLANPLRTLGYIAGGAGISGGMNKLSGLSGKELVNKTLEDTSNFLEKAPVMSGFTKVTDPSITKIAGSALTRLPLKSLANVFQGVSIDKLADMDTTKTSILIDAVFPLGGEAVSAVSKKFAKLFKKADVSGLDNVISEAKSKGVKVSDEAYQFVRDELGRFAKNTGETVSKLKERMIEISPGRTVRSLEGIVPAKVGDDFVQVGSEIKFLDKPLGFEDVKRLNEEKISSLKSMGFTDQQITSSAFGGIAGLEFEKDDKGNITGVKFDPVKGGLGVGLMAGVAKKRYNTIGDILGNKGVSGTVGNNLEAGIKAIKEKFPQLEESYIRNRIGKVGFDKLYQELSTLRQDFNPKNLQNYSSKILKNKFGDTQMYKNNTVDIQPEAPISAYDDVLPRVEQSVQNIIQKPQELLNQPVRNTVSNIITKVDDLSNNIRENVVESMTKIREGKHNIITQQEKDTAMSDMFNTLTSKYDGLVSVADKFNKQEFADAVMGKVTPTKELKPYVEQFKSLMDDLAKGEGLQSIGKDRKNYFSAISNEQVYDEVIGDLFSQSRMTQSILDLPHLKAKNNPDYIGDASLKDTIEFRIRSGIANVFKNVNTGIENTRISLKPNDSVIDQIQKDVPVEQIKDFTGKIGIGQNLKFLPDNVKGGLQVVTKYLEGSYVGGWEDLGLKDLIRPYYLGKVESIQWKGDASNLWESNKNGEQFADYLAKEAGFKPSTPEYTNFVTKVAEKLNNFGNKDLTAKILIEKVAKEKFLNTPLTEIENWVKTNRVVDSESRSFIDRELKNMLGEEAKQFSKIENAINGFRRIQQLAVLGGNVGTVLLQPFEVGRVFSRYNPKSASQAILEVSTGKKPTFEYFANEGDFTSYAVDGKKISEKSVKGVLNSLEKAGFYGIGKAENWKDKVFLRAAELDGTKKGLTGNDLKNYVFDEFRKFGHKYASEDIPSMLKNPITKAGFMFQTYSFKSLGLLLRQVEGAFEGNKNKELQYLAIAGIAGYLQYEFMTNVLKKYAGSKLSSIAGGGLPSLYNPAVDLVKNGYDYLTDEDKESNSAQNSLMKTKKAINNHIPFGNQVLNKTLPAVKNIMQGYDGTISDNVRFPSPETIGDKARSVLFGKDATSESMQYNKEYDRNYLRKNQTEDYKRIYETQGYDAAKKYWQDVNNGLIARKELEKATLDLIKGGTSANEILASEIKASNDSTQNPTDIISILNGENAKSEKRKNILDIVMKRTDVYKNLRPETQQSLLASYGYTKSDIEDALLSSLSNSTVVSRADYIVSQSNPDFAKLYDAGVITQGVADELEKKGYISDAKKFMENMKMTDSFYRKKVAKELNIKYQNDMLENNAKTMTNILKSMSSSSKKKNDILSKTKLVYPNKTKLKVPDILKGFKPPKAERYKVDLNR